MPGTDRTARASRRRPPDGDGASGVQRAFGSFPDIRVSRDRPAWPVSSSPRTGRRPSGRRSGPHGSTTEPRTPAAPFRSTRRKSRPATGLRSYDHCQRATCRGANASLSRPPHQLVGVGCRRDVPPKSGPAAGSRRSFARRRHTESNFSVGRSVGGDRTGLQPPTISRLRRPPRQTPSRKCTDSSLPLDVVAVLDSEGRYDSPCRPSPDRSRSGH